jgi:Ca-activated chloride channel family protein
MNIKHPEYLPLLFLAVGIIFLLIYAWKRRKQVLKDLGTDSKLKNLIPNSNSQKTLLRYILVFIAFLMIIISLISPRWGYEWKQVETKGTNIMIAFDVSASMMATDISPNRLTRAKIEISKLIDRLQGDRLGLIVFAGEGFLQTPLTHDYLLVKDWLGKISIDSVSEPGTSIKSAIATARKAFKHVASESKALVIISDGEEQDKETVLEAGRAYEEGIKIFTIGIGTEKGSPIELDTGLVKDEKGNIVLSKLDDKLLKQVAQAAGGRYLRSTTGDFHIDQLYFQFINENLKDEVQKSGKTKKWYETYQIFMAIAFLALLLEFILAFDLYQKFITIRKKSQKILIISLGASLLNAHPAQANIFNSDLWAGDFALNLKDFKKAKTNYEYALIEEPRNPRLNYNTGISNYREGFYQQAIFNFGRSAEYSQSKKLKQKAFYNLGNAYFKTEDYQNAIVSYEQALKLDPQDADCKHNLELARRMLEQEKQEGKNKSQEDQDQQKNQQDQKKEKPDNQNKNQNNQNPNQKPKPQESQEPSQSEPNKINGLSDDDAERLLMQVEEADPGDIKQGSSSKARGTRNKKLNPW